MIDVAARLSESPGWCGAGQWEKCKCDAGDKEKHNVWINILA